MVELTRWYKVKEAAKIAALFSAIALMGSVIYFLNKQIPTLVEVQMASTRRR